MKTVDQSLDGPMTKEQFQHFLDTCKEKGIDPLDRVIDPDTMFKGKSERAVACKALLQKWKEQYQCH